MAEDLEKVRDLLDSKLSETDVQDVMHRLTQVYKDGSVEIQGDATESVITTGDNNQVTINKNANPRELLDELERIISTAEKIQQRPVRCKTRSMLVTSVGIAALIGIVRFLAGLQPLELWALDGLMATQQLFAQEDSRILVITPDDKEVQAQGPEVNDRGVSFTDDKLAEVLEKIGTYHPLVIGLDLQRPFKAKGKLAQILRPSPIPKALVSSTARPSEAIVKKVAARQKQAVVRKSRSEIMPAPLVAKSFVKPESLNLIGGCKAIETEDKDGKPIPIEGTEIAPPDEISKERIGFVDFAIGVGEQKALRRQILAQEIPPSADKCKTIFAFSVLVAYQFLSKEHGYNKLNSDPHNNQCPQFLHSAPNRNFTFPYFNAVTGGFKGGAEEDSYGGCQILLNYGIKKINTISLTKLFNDDQLERLNPKPKIILIGAAARSHDFWFTPLGAMEGAKIQALTISQTIDTVLGSQRLIWALPELTEFFWILGWSLLGGLLGWRLRSWKPWFLSLTVTTASLCFGCSLSFWLWQLWLPLIPPVLTSLSSAVGVAYLNLRLKLGSSNPFEILRAALIASK